VYGKDIIRHTLRYWRTTRSRATRASVEQA
jgi:hypothetical protein